MEATWTLLHTQQTSTAPLVFPSTTTRSTSSSSSSSLRHFHKHLLCQPRKPTILTQTSRITKSSQIKSSFSDTTATGPQYPFLKPLKNLTFNPFDTFRPGSGLGLAQVNAITPLDVVKWSAILSVSIASVKWAVNNMLLNPFFWVYFSWSWMFWPWFVAIGLGVYGLYCLGKHVRDNASVFEQIAIVTSAFTWLTLVPPAHFNGYLQGWPFVFFFVYHYFFFFNVSVRKRLYGDYFAREHDPKWEINLPRWQRLLFCVGVMVGHWLAAFEGPELHRIPGGWNNVGVWIMILVTLLMQYNSTLYLAKYSEKVVVPTAVVQFGPYRWVRHPIYASTMLLFVTYCVALRAPLSLLFNVAICLLYYEQKAKLEEGVMVDTFGEMYLEYSNKVKHKFIPFLY